MFLLAETTDTPMINTLTPFTAVSADELESSVADSLSSFSRY